MPLPPVSNPFPPPWEQGPAAADPAISAIRTGSYTGNGYGVQAPSTINRGAPTPVSPGPPPAQVRMYVQGGILYFVDNVTGTAYSAGPAVSVPQPPNYSPTK